MTASDVASRLAALPRLANVPREQLDWLAAHGEVRSFAAGAEMFSQNNPPPGPYVILSGRVAVYGERDGVARLVSELGAGSLSGRLPYSRMTNAAGKLAPGAMAGHSQAEEDAEVFMITADIRDLARECYDFTAACVHEMVDRTRLFKTADLQREKMASLGRLAAGLAHELNNPSSAVARSAQEVDACRGDLIDAARALGAAGLTTAQAGTVEALMDAGARPPDDQHSPLARSDREEALETWLDDHGLDGALADRLSMGAVTAGDLEPLRQTLDAAQLPIALRYVASGIAAARLTGEIVHAANRIHSLVAAVKKHTHMDRAPSTEPIDFKGCLSDTLTLIGSKARARSVTLTLDVAEGLPPVHGRIDELNEVWLNLVDNAIDAAPDGGTVLVTVVPNGHTVDVSVIDDGPGIGDDDQLRVFEPFFTTKAVGQGTGLGLDVVQTVIRGHGGTIAVKSKPGRTEFRASLPTAAR